MEPIGISLLWIGYPGRDPIKNRFAGASHTAAVQVIACLNKFELPKQKLLFYTKLLRIDISSLRQ